MRACVCVSHRLELYCAYSSILTNINKNCKTVSKFFRVLCYSHFQTDTMNMSESNQSTPFDTEAIIHELNDKMARLHVPAIVYISVLMVMGLLGNLMVCYYYGFESRKSTNSFFITILAIYDVIVCAISMPTEIFDIVLYYEFQNNAACKILRFVNYFAAIGSILTLIAIATDRFKKICKPTSPQMTKRKAKLVSLGVVAMAILLSWPSLVIYGSIKVNVPNDYGLELKGSDCTSTKDLKFRKYVWAFNGLHFLMFLLCSGVLIVLYSIIGRRIFTHKKQLRKYTKPSKTSSSVNETSLTDTTSASAKGNAAGNSRETEQDKSDGSKAVVENRSSDKENAANKETPVRSTDKTEQGHKASAKKSTDKKQDKRQSGASSRVGGKTSSGINNETIKITVIMIIVTVVFICSFLPYLSLTVWRISTGKHEAEFLSNGGLVAFKIGSRSFLLNSSLNPWIYGIFNSSFREFFFVRPFKKCFKS